MRIALVLSLVLAFFFAAGQPAPPSNLSGQQLRTWLKDNWYTGKYTELSYSDARLAMYQTIDVRSDGQLYGVYSGYKTSPNGTTTPGSINCEHTIPQSFFNSDLPMRSDIHHLFPTHATVNSARSNYPYIEIDDALTDQWYGSDNSGNLVSTSSKPSQSIDIFSEVDGSTFEPREDHKGDAARAIFYFFTMYEGQMASYGKSIDDLIANGDLNLLYTWHQQDPVDGWERQRNDRTEEEQGNRNPYIDYPEVVCSAWGFTCPDPTGATIIVNDNGFSSTFQSTLVNTLSEDKSLNISTENLEGNLSIVVSQGFLISIDQQSFISNLTITPEDGAISTAIFVRFAPTSAQTYNGQITLSSTNATSKTIELSGIGYNESFVFTEQFETCESMNQFTAYSIVGDESWYCTDFGVSGSGAFRMNGYNGGAQQNEDWLVSDAIDLRQFSEATLTFQSDVGFTGPVLELLVSEDFTGSVTDASWTKLSAAYDSDSGNDTWTSSGSVNLEAFSGKTIVIAFKYTSNTSSAARWTIDDVVIEGVRSSNIWYGTQSNDPLNAANWSKGSVPFSSQNVIIPKVQQPPVLNGDLVINDIELAEGATLTASSGALLAIYGDASGNGEVIIQRNITNSQGYSIVSSPVESISTDKLGAALIYGVEGSSFTSNLVNDPVNMQPGQGFFVSTLGSDAAITFKGKPNTGIVNSAVVAGHFELVGNPYTAPIRVTDFLEANMDYITGAVYFWDDGGVNLGTLRGGDFITVNAIGAVGTSQPNGNDDGAAGLIGSIAAEKGIIASCQGVYVEAIGSGDLVFNTNMLETESGANADEYYYRKHDYTTIQLRVDGNGLSTATLLGFGEDATLGRDWHLDATKIESDYPLRFYSMLGEEKLAIQGLPVVDEQEMIIDLALEAPEGTFTLSVPQVELSEEVGAILTDLTTGEKYDLKKAKSVNISMNQNENIRYFELSVKRLQPLAESPFSGQLKITITSSEIEIFSPEGTDQPIRILDLTGKILHSEKVLFDNDHAFINLELKEETVYIMHLGNQSVKFLIRK